MVTQLERVQAFADASVACTSLGDLSMMVGETALDLGAEYFLMVHHADFSRGPRGLVRLGNYPWEFMRISRQDGTPLDDPIMEACERTLTGFFWSDVGAHVRLTEKHRRRIAAVAETGLADGFVVPTHVPGEHLGSCHFAAGVGGMVPRASAGALQLLALFGFEAARRLVRVEEAIVLPRRTLTDRQRECLILSARGKSDTVIGDLLGLSAKTVNNYIEAAKRRYEVATRAQLIVRALYASEITFTDIVEGLPPGTCRAALH